MMLSGKYCRILMHRNQVMYISIKNGGVSMQRGQVVLLSVEHCSILIQKYKVMHFSSKKHGVSMHRCWIML